MPVTAGDTLELWTATAADSPALGELLHRCNSTYRTWAPKGWEPPSAESERQGWRQRFESGGHWVRVVCSQERSVVAVGAWTQAIPGDGGRPPAGTVAHVSSLFVDPSCWRRGIATALLAAAEDSMREHGYTVAQLWTPERADARCFYEARGWREDGRRRWFADLALPLVAYGKELRVV